LEYLNFFYGTIIMITLFDLEQLLPNINDMFIFINNFLELTFFYLKYIFFGILLIMGLLTLLSLRGRYFLERLRYSQEQKLADSPLTKPRLILGSFYIFFAFGILFNWFTYFLIVILDPLPDRFIFTFIEFAGVMDPFQLNRISDISLTIYDYEKTIYYGVAILSFIAVLNIMISVWQLINKGGRDSKKSIIMLVSGLGLGIFSGFTTCLPLFL